MSDIKCDVGQSACARTPTGEDERRLANRSRHPRNGPGGDSTRGEHPLVATGYSRYPLQHPPWLLPPHVSTYAIYRTSCWLLPTKNSISQHTYKKPLQAA